MRSTRSNDGGRYPADAAENLPYRLDMRSWGGRVAVALALVIAALLFGCGSGGNDSSISTTSAGPAPIKTAHKDAWSCPSAPSNASHYAGPRSTAGRPLVPGLLGHAPQDACQQ